MINAEDFLNDDDAALGRPRRIDAICTELVAVAGSQFEVRSHVWSPLVLRNIQRAESGCRGGFLPPGVASSAVLLNMAKVMYTPLTVIRSTICWSVKSSRAFLNVASLTT